MNSSANRIVEARGPRNSAISSQDVHEVAAFARSAELTWDADCDGILPDFADEPIIGPQMITLGGKVAFYTEWSTAVRIDLVTSEDDTSSSTTRTG